MRRFGFRIAAFCALSIGIAVAGTHSLEAQSSQAPAPKRNILLRQDMTIPGPEAVLGSVDLAPGSAEVRHTHPAETYGFVQEGTITLEIAGQPTKTFKAGDVFYIPPETIHQGFNKSGAPAKISVIFIAEKGKPLVTEVK